MHDTQWQPNLLNEGGYMSWRDEVDAHVKMVIPSKPIYEAFLQANANYIIITPAARPTTDSESNITQMLTNFAEEHVRDGKHELAWSGGPHSRIWETVKFTVLDFIIDFSTAKTVRLTSLWRWYDTNISDSGKWPDNMYEQFQEDIWAWFKWVWDRDKVLTESEIKTAFGLLKIIKQKYEVQEVTL